MCLIHLIDWLCLLFVLSTSSSTVSSIEINSTHHDGTPSSTSTKWLSVMLVRVGSDSVLLEWSCFPPAVRQQLVTCQARYGLLTPEKTVLQETTNSTNSSGSSWWRFEQTQIDVLDHFLPESNSFRLTNLTTNTSYVFAMICILWVGSEAGGNAQHAEELGGTNHQPKSAMNGHHHYGTITSNPIFFTTRSTNFDAMMKDHAQLPSRNNKPWPLSAGSPSRYRSHQPTSVDLNDHMDPIRWTTKLSQRPSTTLSYSIILGIVCGLIGFLIINVTIVMALRKYSRWRSRQARIRHLRFIYGDSADHYYDVT